MKASELFDGIKITDNLGLVFQKYHIDFDDEFVGKLNKEIRNSELTMAYFHTKLYELKPEDNNKYYPINVQEIKRCCYQIFDDIRFEGSARDLHNITVNGENKSNTKLGEVFQESFLVIPNLDKCDELILKTLLKKFDYTERKLTFTYHRLYNTKFYQYFLEQYKGI